MAKPRTRKQLLRSDLLKDPATKQELARAFLELNEGSRKIHGRSTHTNSNQRDIEQDLSMDAIGTPKAPLNATTAYQAELQKLWLRRTNEYDIVGIDEPVPDANRRISELEGWAKTPMTTPTKVTSKKVLSTTTTTEPVGTRVIVPKSKEDLDKMRKSEADSQEAIAQAVESEVFGIEPEVTTAIPESIDDTPLQEPKFGYDEFGGSGLANADQESAVVAMVDQIDASVDGDKKMVFDLLGGQNITTLEGDSVEVTDQRIRMAYKVIEKHGSFAKDIGADGLDETWGMHGSVTQKSLDKSTRGV